MTDTSSPHIAIFDSGMGGISIYDAVLKQYPHCRLSYCSDNAAFPYGTKSETELVERVSKVLTALNEQYQPDIFIIACNTASTLALPKIRANIKQPVIGVVPAIKPVAQIAKTPYAGLLATPATVNRAYTQSLIDEFSSSLQWIKVGSSELVLLAEKKMHGERISQAAIEKTIAPFAQYSAEQLDTIVLGCTHFPLIKKELQLALPNVLHWVDSTDAIVNRVSFWLHELGLGHSNIEAQNTSENNFITTSKTKHLAQRFSEKNLRILSV